MAQRGKKSFASSGAPNRKGNRNSWIDGGKQYIMVENPYAKIPTERLRFLISVGKTGLLEWKGPRLAEVRKQVELMEEELEHRGKP